MWKPPKKERQSIPVRIDRLPPLTEEEKALQEAANTLLQYDRMDRLIDGALYSSSPFRLRPHTIQDLNRISLQRIEEDAGRWRDVPMRIEESEHNPPAPEEVPRYIDEMCEYVNDNWQTASALHLGAYVMWRLNWIHPFIDGNGRTTRALSYFVLCVKWGFRIPGVKTIPELISKNKKPYYKALEAADAAYAEGKINVRLMESLLKDLLASQMVEAIDRADSARKIPEHRKGPLRSSLPQQAVGSSGEAHRFARLAIEEARKSVPENDGRPHPMVGAVVVKNGNVLATAHRGEAKGNHAEYIVLEKRLGDAAVAGATVYTTLEPCTTRNHPKIPCVERLIERKVGRVVIGMLDPDPRITGRGQRRLRSANIITDFFPHDLMTEVEELNRDFTRKFESASRVADWPPLAVEPQAVGTRHRTTDVVDKWVSLGYEHKSGVAKTLDQQGFDLRWVSADKEAEKVEFEGWDYVLVDQPDGNRARLKIHDHSAVGGYLVLLKRRRR